MILSKCLVNSPRSEKPRAVAPKVESDSARVADKACRHVDDVLDDGADASTFHVAADWRIILAKTFLPHDAEEIVGKHAGMQHQIIGGEFPGGQTLQVQIGFDFAVKLFACAVIAIQFDHSPWSTSKRSPVYRNLNLRNEQYLSVVINRPFNDVKHLTQLVIESLFGKKLDRTDIFRLGCRWHTRKLYRLSLPASMRASF